MTEEERGGDGRGEVPQGGVFGNLPGSRPGVRSPRRGRGPQASEPAAPDRPEPPPPISQPRAPEPPREPPQPGPQAERRGGIEDVAWAGVAAAAEAATIGVRIANRAIEALREAVDRR